MHHFEEVHKIGFFKMTEVNTSAQSFMFPDLSFYGYKIEKLLGQNSNCGRSTFLAKRLKNNSIVVLKLIQFFDTNWFPVREQFKHEVEILKKIDTPRVPKHIEHLIIPNENYLILVQEYVEAIPLSELNNLKNLELKEIARQTLEVLRYLQDSIIPPMAHLDIKPENILVKYDNINLESIEVFLVDFGVCKMIPTSDTALRSSMMGGTFGFTPLRVLAGVENPTVLTDMQSLGYTICCLTLRIGSKEFSQLFAFDSIEKLSEQRIVYEFRDIWKWSLQLIDREYRSVKEAQEALKKITSIKTEKNPKGVYSCFSKLFSLRVYLSVASILVILGILYISSGLHFSNDANVRPPGVKILREDL
jgi:serine/threonine protein kinase